MMDMIADVEYVKADVIFNTIKGEHIIKALSWLERHRWDWFSLRKETAKFILRGDRFPVVLVVSVAYSIAKTGEYKYVTIIGCDTEEMINMLEKNGFPKKLKFRIFEQVPGVEDVGSDYIDIVKIETKHIKSALDFLSRRKWRVKEGDFCIYNGNKYKWWSVVRATYWAAKNDEPSVTKRIPKKDEERDSSRIYYIIEDKCKEIDGLSFGSVQWDDFYNWLKWEPNDVGDDYLEEEDIEKYLVGIDQLDVDFAKKSPEHKSIWSINSVDEVDNVLVDCEKSSDLLKNEYGIKGLNKYKEFLLDDTSSFHSKVKEAVNESVDIGINFDNVKEEHVKKALEYLYDIQDYGKYKAITHFVLYKNKKITLKLVLAVAYKIAEIGELEIKKLDGYNTHQIADFVKSANLLSVLRAYNTHKMADILKAKDFADKIGYKIEIVKKQVVDGGENIIFYGVPGCGKSYIVKQKIGEALGEELDDDELDEKYRELSDEKQIVRVVFHPDYTYSDFIGQILPEEVGDGKIAYKFRPGPFTKILKDAINKPKEPFFLVIEEINRGNAAMIFGDLFQLLDRDDDGNSEYEVDNCEIGQVVHNITNNNNNIDIPQIFIPKNLWLFATMNTSDQNVFPLDTAFQRRWEMELIHNNLKEQPEFFIEGTNVTWERFATVVNSELEKPDTMMSGDKRLGAWFIKPDPDLNIGDKKFVSKKRFANKVLKYLWDDAFKFNRPAFFNTDDYKTLEDVIEKFVRLKDGQGFGNLFNISIGSTTKEEVNKNEEIGE